jgi:hypothetical protein
MSKNEMKTVGLFVQVSITGTTSKKPIAAETKNKMRTKRITIKKAFRIDVHDDPSSVRSPRLDFGVSNRQRVPGSVSDETLKTQTDQELKSVSHCRTLLSKDSCNWRNHGRKSFQLMKGCKSIQVMIRHFTANLECQNRKIPAITETILGNGFNR